MKRRICVAVLAAALIGTMAVPAYAEETETTTEEWPSTENEPGKIGITGYEFYTYNDKEYVIIFSDFENTTSEESYCNELYREKVYQDGVELELGTTDYGYTQERGMECDDKGTKTLPGGKIHYFTAYELKSQSDLVYQVNIFLQDETLISYDIPYGGSGTAPTNEDYKAMYEELLEKYNALQAEYDALKAE